MPAAELILAINLASNLINRLPDLAIKEVGNVWKVEKNLRSLVRKLQTIQNSLDQLDNEELAKAKWRPWLQNLTKLFYEVEDVIDDINIDIMESNNQMAPSQVMVVDQECSLSTSAGFLGVIKKILTPAPTYKNQVRNSILSSFTKLSVGKKISKLLSKFKELEADVRMIPDTSNMRGKVNSSETTSDSGLCLAQVTLTKRRKEEKEIICKYLINHSDNGKGIAIFGMAGSGKTTLARSIQRDATITKHFNHVIWASVPRNFNFETKILIEDGEGLPVVNRSINNERQPQVNRSINYLLQRTGRTLLVLDDIWNLQYHNWKNNILSNNISKLTILITTRDPRVAKITGTHCYHIEALSASECKELIDMELPPYFLNKFDHPINILAEKCSGLPLIAKELGQAIGSMPDRPDDDGMSRYDGIKDLWDLKVFRDVIFPALKFNDPSLPPELSKCLAYMTLFPQGYEFKRDEVSQLWLSEGFLPPEDEMWTTSELIKAGDYFDDLYWRSIIQLSNHDGLQEKKLTYKMNEFLFGFAQSMAFNICHHAEDGKQLFTALHILHLSICCQTVEQEYLEMIAKFCKRLRTFILLHKDGTNIPQIPEYLFEKLNYLRVVNISNSSITRLPNSIRNLRHLRCLDASNTSLKILNEKLCDLFGLRILRLTGCFHLLRLPQEIRKLVNLIFLEVDIQRLRSTPLYLGSLIKLRGLEVYIVKQEEGKRISELKNMNHLRGSIRIKGLENVRSGLEAKGANLVNKTHLKGLELHWTKTLLNTSPSEAESVLTELEPCEGLQELKLMCYNGGRLPNWLSSPTRGLKKIHLYDCPTLDNLSIFWQLPYLNDLLVDTLPGIKQVDRKFLGDAHCKRFARLERLGFRNMRSLARWEKLVPGDFPRLGYLTIVACSALTEWPTFEHLRELREVRHG